MFAEFHFLRPLWLLLLLPLFVLVPWWLKRSSQSGIARQVIAPHLQQYLVQSAEKVRKFPWKIATAIWVIASLSAAGPAWIEQPIPVTSQDRGYVILFDASMDTRATDLTPDRHTRLKYKALDLINALKDGQTGLVAYSGDAFTIAPLTRDPENLQSMMPALTPEIMPVPGRNPLAGFQMAHDMLTQAGYSQGDIYWFSGSIDRADMEDIRQFLREANHRVSVITAGTEDGAPVRTEQGELLRTPQGDLVIPRLFVDYFENIAQQTGGIHRSISSNSGDIDALISLPEQSANATERESINHNQWLDMGPYLLWLMLPLLFALGRKTQVLSIAGVLLLSQFLTTPPVYATNAEDSDLVIERVSWFNMNSVRNAFRNKEQNALNAYQSQQYDRTEGLSDDPMLQGMAAYRAGDYEQAAQYFGQQETAESFYNLGNSLAHSGHLEEAIDAYDQALQQRPNWQSALENKEIVEQMKEQQSQQENESGDSDQNQQGEDQESNDGQESQDSSSSDQSDASQSEQENSDTSPSEEQNADGQSQEQQEQNDSQTAEQQQQSAETEGNEEALEIPEAWQDLSEEERAELEQLLRRLPNDPALLLKNRLLLEAERRRLQRFN
ncbi:MULTISPECIES: tetratricopeptide repeat protein [Gammaproteobacteria]|uniref:vWA domain-containing protein n=1 Tax=Gammaproteobacteria TaxID=1236 RepID=UPI000DD07375|nr:MULTISPECIES: tetratricopeptide repeat protein [Gammaproteobacteria]RTE86894.1 VWA domain-containing protein [Aliidiomarina sp. B3213]TCZ93316.1 tetratricopeptide repeat protein [Lysobacter sp. N42]